MGAVVTGALVGRGHAADAATRTEAVELGPSTSLQRAATGGPTYRPLKIADPRRLPHFPSNVRLRTWNPSWNYLQDGLAACGPDEILVLPERREPYVINARGGMAGRNGAPMAPMGRGLVGLGPGAVIEPSASWWARSEQRSGLPNDSLISSSTADAYFGNVELRGRNFGGFAYNGVRMYGDRAVVENVYFKAAHRGFKNAPPGETAAVNNWRGSDQLVVNCEVECRDGSGRRVGSSPIMFNNQRKVRVEHVYGHHSVAGMPTFYKVTDARTLGLRSEHNGSGRGSSGLNGHGINHELCAGTIVHEGSTLMIDYRRPVNDGLHMSYGSNVGSAGIKLVDPRFDDGPTPGAISVQLIGTRSSYSSFVEPRYIQAVTADGRPIPVRIHRP